jgi:CTP synthase (UTP-ammonia lyase)
MLQKHNWYISMQFHSSNASETQLVYLNAMPLFKSFRNTTGISQSNATVQMLQKHNWYISMKCHSSNSSETQLVYLNAMPEF